MTERAGRPISDAAEQILGRYFPVLDHGFVALIDYMGNDASIEQAARVSYGLGTRHRSETRALLRYLRRHKHTTPSEMVELKFHCCMPIFVARQWVRHRTASINEYSGRYSIVPSLFYTPEKEQVQTQSRSNNQGRSGDAAAATVYEEAIEKWLETRARVVSAYEWLTENDVARELARIDLPLSTYTQWYWKIDLHNLLHFLTLRVDEHAQWEMREFARVIAGMLKRVAPLSFEAWIDYDVCGRSFSRMELNVLRKLLKVEGQAVSPSGAELGQAALATYELSAREVQELIGKLQGRADVPAFDLDLASARDASYFESKFQAAVRQS